VLEQVAISDVGMMCWQLTQQSTCGTPDLHDVPVPFLLPMPLMLPWPPASLLSFTHQDELDAKEAVAKYMCKTPHCGKVGPIIASGHCMD
jgi:hypothetical protein